MSKAGRRATVIKIRLRVTLLASLMVREGPDSAEVGDWILVILGFCSLQSMGEGGEGGGGGEGAGKGEGGGVNMIRVW